MNINNTLLFIKKKKWFDFIENAEIYGFKTDICNDYICKKILSDNNDLYLQITIDSISRNIFIELINKKEFEKNSWAYGSCCHTGICILVWR